MFDPAGEFCISDENRRLVLEDLENWRAALARCNGTIGEYNKSVK
jgi:hypothetical protein